MIKRFTLLTTILSMFIGLNMQAQVVLNSSNFPQEGDTFERVGADASDFDPGMEGEGITWNYDNLIPAGGGVFGPYVTAASTPFGSEYPTATVATNDGTTTLYYSVNTVSSAWVGRADDDGTLFDYVDPIDEMQYPFGFGDNWFDEGDRTYDVGALVGSKITRDVTGDATGTLILPNATYDDVLRVRIEETYRDTLAVDPSQYFERVSTRYEWYVSDQRLPVMIYETGFTDQSGTITEFASLNYAFVNIVQDEYGYTYTEGEECEWIDISEIGTEVSGLADDNFVGPFSMGIDFQYYWTTQNEIYIGSNGYVSFDPIQISSTVIGFPFIPTPNEQNNFIAPLLSDLSFSGPGNPGRCLIFNDSERFIVTYENVPFWTNNVNQYTGSNTFQVVFSAVDSTITVNYLNMNTEIATEYLDAQNPVVIGIENISGDIGLEYSNTDLPASNSCITFTPPTTPLIDVLDAAPTYNQNEANGGFFLFVGDIYELTTNIKNVGSIDITDPIEITSNVLNSDGGVFVTNEATIAPPLAPGETQLITFDNQFPAINIGTFTYDVTTATEGDINPNNDNNISELVVVDSLTNGEITLGYTPTAPTNAGAVSWTGGSNFEDGAGIYVEPPFYPVEIVAAEYLVATDGSAVGFGAKVQGTDASGAPGDVLAEGFVTSGELLPSVWNRVTFDEPILLESGGAYVSWLMENTGIQLTTDLDAPYSRRSFEILGDAWAPYRSGDQSDVCIRVIVKSTEIVGINDNLPEGFGMTEVYPNPAQGFAYIKYSIPTPNNVIFSIVDATGKEVIRTTNPNEASGEHTVRINTSELPAGMYLCSVRYNEYVITKQLIVNN